MVSSFSNASKPKIPSETAHSLYIPQPKHNLFKMHSLKGALTGLTLSLILLASETLAHPAQAGALGLRSVTPDAK